MRRISKNEGDQLWLIELGKKLELTINTQGYRSIYDFWLNCSSSVVSRSTLNSILAGKSDPKITSLMALCDQLGVSLTQVLPDWPCNKGLGTSFQAGYNFVMKKVLICGFMGSGKSTLLKRMQLSYDQDGPELEFLDLDELIFQKNARPGEKMQEMILRMGWTKFREKEQCILKELVEDEGRPFVMALGGGALENNLKWVQQWKTDQQVSLVWLDTPLTQCLRQARKSGDRPLLRKSDQELIELYAERLAQYAIADISLTPDQQDALKTWDQLQAMLK